MNMRRLSHDVVDCVCHIFPVQQRAKSFVEVPHHIITVARAILKPADYDAGLNQLHANAFGPHLATQRFGQ